MGRTGWPLWTGPKFGLQVRDRPIEKAGVDLEGSPHQLDHDCPPWRILTGAERVGRVPMAHRVPHQLVYAGRKRSADQVSSIEIWRTGRSDSAVRLPPRMSRLRSVPSL